MANTQEQNFDVLVGCRGYVSKPDITNTKGAPRLIYRNGRQVQVEDEGFLVSGSQNMLINDQEIVTTRAGYELFGAASTDRNKIQSEHVWRNSNADEIFLRFTNNTLEYYSANTSAWETLLGSLDSDFPMRFGEIWDTSELIDLLLFVNHSANLYEWSGGIGTYASSTSNTIVISETISEEHFYSSGYSGAKIRVKDSGGTWREFTVDSHTSSTFTVSGDDPTNYTFTAGTIVVQSVITNSNKPASGYINDSLSVLNNQVYVGSATSRVVYISDDADRTDYAPATPRIPGDGASIVLDDVTTGFAVDSTREGEESMLVFSGKDRVYRVEFILQAGSTADREIVKVRPIVNAANQGAISQELITRVKRTTVFVNNNNELVDLASLENNPDSLVPISDPIKPDFVDASFTNGNAKVWRSSLYITAPVTGKTFILDLSKFYWHSPQILPVGQLSVYSNDLYGHSNAVTESYKLFTGTNDNTKPIAFRAHFAYRHHGMREMLKTFDRFYSELKLSSNTTLRFRLIYEYLGAKGLQEYEFKGADSDYIFTPNPNASLGVNSLGASPLGATLEEPENMLKYRRIKKVQPVNNFEYQVQYRSDEKDAQFSIIAHGPNVRLADGAPVTIIG